MALHEGVWCWGVGLVSEGIAVVHGGGCVWGRARGHRVVLVVLAVLLARAPVSGHAAAKGDGSYTVPLTYGKDKAGTVAWRIAVIRNGTTLYFGEHRLIRTRMAVRIAVIGDILTQAATINPATKLVLVTAGGNAAGFGNVLTAFNSGMVYPPLWPLFFAQAKAADDRISQLSRDHQTLFKTVAERIGDRPEGRIIFLGYPKVFIPPFLPAVGMVNQLQEKLENSQLEAARQWNASHRLKVSFIPVDGADRRGYKAGVFRGHEADPRPGIANHYRWINESLETAGVFLPSLGKTQAKDSKDMMEWFHPNVTGHYELARLLTKRVQPSSSGIRISSTAAHEEELLSPLLPPDDVLSQDLTLSAWLEGDEVTKRGTAMVFDASGTICGGHQITAYHWDFDSDGNTDLTTQTPQVTYTFPRLFDGTVTVTVETESGQIDSATMPVTVSADGDRIPDHLDNCPQIANTSQRDHDNDGIGDQCDSTPGDPLLEER
ncbi:PKD domain-containing protein [uncultured Tessaracoccus sp.]|uniref:PKD domain-containing protein n=1 Tax=uncultured Tessaracoccus sp. TaxID=905023 RepID=UPI0025F991C3|nr:PKD domain-containing protein [uncultured Tessaracoccus sp.]